MSTKIYEGKILRVKNLNEVHERIMTLRPKAQKIAKQNYDEMVSRIAIREYVLWSRKKLTPGKDSWSPVSMAEGELRNRQKSKEKIIGLSMTIHPVRKKILAIVFDYSYRIYDKLLAKEKWIESYGYWDNTDPPKDLSTRQWNQRKKDWDDAILEKKDGRPCYNGFIAEIVDEEDYMVMAGPGCLGEKCEVDFEKLTRDVCRLMGIDEYIYQRGDEDAVKETGKTIKQLSEGKEGMEKIDIFNKYLNPRLWKTVDSPEEKKNGEEAGNKIFEKIGIVTLKDIYKKWEEIPVTGE